MAPNLAADWKPLVDTVRSFTLTLEPGLVQVLAAKSEDGVNDMRRAAKLVTRIADGSDADAATQ